MNLTKLFEKQQELDARILLEKGLVGQDLLDKKILALQVELGELANEWRGFKFWKVDNEPRTCVINKDGETANQYYTNPLLEEYVDCLHFILSIGNDLKCELEELEPGHFPTISETLINLIRDPAELKYDVRDGIYEEFIVTYTDMFELFLGLGSQLGFTWEQIEQAYFDKNKINHERQNNGY
ncbi:dUTP diphosphatase [Oceanobacillus sp. FSL H7-0719]|uniref:dUTP diphosphatase n=1 Tax=Oceanobacillus sp. FSL H7-0719 TaxID=2954507 RepID=UPI00324A8A39